MQDPVNAAPVLKRIPWNTGKLTGAKPPLRPKHVRSIRTKLQIEGRARDLAMFNLVIDSKLRGCDVVAIRVEDVAGGYTADRATVRQKKNGRPVRFELTEQTRQAVDDYLRGKRPGELLFAGHRGPDRSFTSRQYGRLVSRWIGSAGLDPRDPASAEMGLRSAHLELAKLAANPRATRSRRSLAANGRSPPRGPPTAASPASWGAVTPPSAPAWPTLIYPPPQYAIAQAMLLGYRSDRTAT